MFLEHRDNTEEEIKDCLELTYGEDFQCREGQIETIAAVMRGGSTLVVQKTGWGKSAVYFAATKLLRGRGAGLTVIISPLTALMDNQVNAAREFGVRAVAVHSGNDFSAESLRRMLQNDECDALLLSPERLSNDAYYSALTAPEVKVGLLVVDEAHCISVWGHDFRPDFKRVSKLIEDLPSCYSILGTTATATSRVVEDVRSQLGDNTTVLRGNLVRDNLAIQINPEQTHEERLAWLAEALGDGGCFSKGQGLVYCTTRNDCNRVATYLENCGVSIKPYYSGRREREKLARSTLSDFEDGRVRVLAATVKLGMGFDKKDIRFVVNYQLPENIVSYYQQIGRAGRDGKKAYAVLLHGPGDEAILEDFIKKAFSEPELLARILEECRHGKKKQDLLKTINCTPTKLKEAIAFLCVNGFLVRDGMSYSTSHERLFDQEEERKRQDELSKARRRELDRFKEFLSTDECLMRFVVRELDAPDCDEDCGICKNCRRDYVVPAVPRERSVTAAKTFLDEAPKTIRPRKQWPDGRRIPEKERIQQGWFLDDYKETDSGRLVKSGKYGSDKYFSDELVRRSKRRLLDHVKQHRIDLVVAVPSCRHPDLVPDFAMRLAQTLDIPYAQGVLVKQDNGQCQKDLNNSYLQEENIRSTVTVSQPGTVRGKRILLVDDMVDTGWTFTVIGSMLLRCGAADVYPFALARTGIGDD